MLNIFELKKVFETIKEVPKPTTVKQAKELTKISNEFDIYCRELEGKIVELKKESVTINASTKDVCNLVKNYEHSESYVKHSMINAILGL